MCKFHAKKSNFSILTFLQVQLAFSCIFYCITHLLHKRSFRAFSLYDTSDISALCKCHWVLSTPSHNAFTSILLPAIFTKNGKKYIDFYGYSLYTVTNVTAQTFPLATLTWLLSFHLKEESPAYIAVHEDSGTLFLESEVLIKNLCGFWDTYRNHCNSLSNKESDL